MVDHRVGRNLVCLNPLTPHDALKHHFTSLKTDLIFLQLGILEYIFHETVLPIHGNFRHFSPTSNHLHPLQVENPQFSTCSG